MSEDKNNFIENLKVWKSLLWSEDKSQKALHVMMVVAAFMIMGIMVMWLLTGCAMFEYRFEVMKFGQTDDQVCCTSDAEFEPSCDGFILCDEPIQLKETEE